MRFNQRDTGLPLIGELAWGSHFCQFYQTRDDLLELVLPYFRAGSSHNEACTLICRDNNAAAAAKTALTAAGPALAEMFEASQLTAISVDKWMGDGMDADGALVAELDRAVRGGHDGVRLVWDAFEYSGKDGDAVFSDYDLLSRLNLLAMFAYPRDRFDALGLMDVVKNHSLALIKNADTWEVIESSEARVVKNALRRSEEKLESLFSNR